MSISQNYPITSPSLSLDFANTKVLDPRITFSRPTDAVYYDGKTVTKAEENLLKYSQDFDNAYWPKFQTTVTANSTTAPDGTTTADSLVNDGTNNFHGTRFAPFTANSEPKTLSVFFKANQITNVSISLTDTGGYLTNGAVATFDLTAGTVSKTGGAAYVSSSITALANGWYRCLLTAQNATLQYGWFWLNSTNNPTYAGFGYETFSGTAGDLAYLWGAQLEARSTVTAYQPTTTQPITNYIPTLLTAPANTARFDHDPVTGESLGLLVEEQRTNLVTYSEDFSNVAWTKVNATVESNVVVSPDGNLSGDKLVSGVASGSQSGFVGSSIALTAQSYVISFRVKYAGVQFFQCWAGGDAWSGNANIDILNATVGTTNSCTANITLLGNGWLNIAVTFTASAGSLVPWFSFVDASTSGRASSYTGNGYSGIYVWGAQLEAGAFPTSYVKTEASQATRSADSASMTGTNFTSLFNPAEYSVYTEASFMSASTANQPVVNIDASLSTTNWRAFGNGLGGGGNRWRIWTQTSSDLLIGVDGSIPTDNVPTKAAYAFEFNNASLATGSTIVTDTSCQVISVLDRLRIGAYQYGFLSGHVAKIAIYPQRLSNTQLQALTS